MTSLERTAPFVRITAVAGGREALLGHVRSLFDAHACDPAFVSGSIHRSVDEADVVVVHEVWNESREAFGRRLTTAEAFTTHGARAEPFVAKREVTWLESPALWRCDHAS